MSLGLDVAVAFVAVEWMRMKYRSYGFECMT
jgi:hypothetical protein